MSNKLAMFDKLKNTMQEVEWHSTFDFESYEINAEDKAFIEKKEEFISNSFKKYSSSKYDICMALVEVKMKLQKAKEGSFMAWYSHLGFTKDKVSELLKTYELYIQAPHMKDYISSLSGVAVRLLTHKDVDPQLALDIMEKGVKNMEDIRELIELALSPAEPKRAVEYKGSISKKSLGAIKSIEKQIKKSSSPAELSSAKKEIEAMKKLLSEMEKDISAKEKEYENKNNLKLPTSPAPVIEEFSDNDFNNSSAFIDEKGYIYFVRAGIGGSEFKVYFAKTLADYKNDFRVHGVKSPLLPYRKTRGEAYADLISYARSKKMKPLKEIN